MNAFGLQRLENGQKSADLTSSLSKIATTRPFTSRQEWRTDLRMDPFSDR